MADTQTDDQTKIAELEGKLKTLTADKEAVDKQNAKLTADLKGLGDQFLKAQNVAVDLNKQVSALTVDKSALSNQLDQATSQLSQATEVVSDLRQKLIDTQTGVIKLPTIKVGKDTYELVTEFYYKEQTVTLALLEENTALAQELVKEGIANLRKVVAKA